MKINIFCMGYVGCVSGVCLANDGHDITGIEVDPLRVEIINSGMRSIVEPGLEDLIKRAVEAGKLRARSIILDQLRCP